jgi:hypothetical protein
MEQKNSALGYLGWNDIIAKHFFHEEKACKEVLLYVNEHLIEELGSPHAVGLNDFVQAVKDGPGWVTRKGFCQRALQAYLYWRRRGLEYPPYITYLALFVLAGGTKGDFAPHAYYPRLRKLLGEDENAGALPSFDKMIELWDDLEKWSTEDKHESIGRFEARIRGGWWKVGLPLSQTIISEDERKHLPVIFSEAVLDPTDSPPPEVMLRILKQYGRSVLQKRTYSLLDNQSERVLKNALTGLVIDELEEWDGTLAGQEGATDTPQRRTAHTGLRICLSVDMLSRTAECRVRFKTKNQFPEEGLDFSCPGDPSHIWSCTEIHQGWSKILKDNQFHPPVMLDGASLDWINGSTLRDQENGWQAKLRGSTTKLFISGRTENLSGWVEKQRLERNVEFRIVSYGADIETVRKWGNECCAGFQEHVVTGLPEGWILFEGKDARNPCPGIDVLTMSSTVRLLIRGGIKTGTGNAYLRFAPPHFVVENGQGGEVVTLNGQELEKVAPHIPVWRLPTNTPVDTPLRIETTTGEQTLRRTLRLEEPELPVLSTYEHSRDASGNVTVQVGR